MSRDPIIEEIRRAQNAIRRSRGGAPADPGKTSPAFPAEFAEVIGELFSRLDRTQEHLLRTIAERTTAAAAVAPSPAGSVEENAILEEILARLDQSSSGGSGSSPELEGRLDDILTAVQKSPSGGGRVDLEPISDRLDAIEHRLRNASGEGGTVDLEPVTAEIRALGEKLSMIELGGGGDGEGGGVSLGPIVEKLDSIEERLGGDAGAMTLGAAVSRIAETLERVESSMGSGGEGAPATPAIDPEWLTRIEETINKLAEEDDGDSAAKAISTLKRDFSLLVHTINGHLQESRHRSEKVETALDHICNALGPIAKMAGVEMEPLPEAEPA